jgi:RNA polymerase sigma-70 factor (ECF subfamily)
MSENEKPRIKMLCVNGDPHVDEKGRSMIFSFQNVRGQLWATDQNRKTYNYVEIRKMLLLLAQKGTLTLVEPKKEVEGIVKNTNLSNGGLANTDRRRQLELLAQFHECVPMLRRLAYGFTNNWDDADELVLDVRQKVWEKWMQFQPGTNFKGWVSIVLRNHYFSQQRKRRREVRGESAETAIQKGVDQGVDALTALSKKEIVHLIRQHLDELSNEHKEAIRLVYLEERPYEDAARIADVPVGTMKSRVNRAIAVLRENVGGTLTQDDLE